MSVADGPEEIAGLIAHGISPEVYVVLPSEHGRHADAPRHLAMTRHDLPRPRAVVVMGDVPALPEATSEHPLLFAPADTTAEQLRMKLPGILQRRAAS